MGLDMYLTKKIYIGAEYEHRNVKGEINITIGGKKVDIDFSKVSYIEERAGYWRKANAIHKWFVENVQDGNDDCGDYHVSSDQLKTLLDLCRKVKKVAKLKDGAITNGHTLEGGVWVPCVEMGKEITNPEAIHAILPTQSGFFFGSTDYDQYYMDDINDTIEILEDALKDEAGDFYYHSSW